MQDIVFWLKHQPESIVCEFKNGAEYYRWGEDIPSDSDFSTAFKLGWVFAKFQHSN
ncbi:MAG TPA: hypothetical protein V6D31_10510 [Candidatus Sericytochromatia bacterium]